MVVADVDVDGDDHGRNFASATVEYRHLDQSSRHQECRLRSSRVGCRVMVAIACTPHTPSDHTLEAPYIAAWVEEVGILAALSTCRNRCSD